MAIRNSTRASEPRGRRPAATAAAPLPMSRASRDAAPAWPATPAADDSPPGGHWQIPSGIEGAPLAEAPQLDRLPDLAVDEAAAVDPGVRHRLIAEAAYRRFELRGREHGRDVDDWIAAESEIDALLSRRALPSG